MNRIKIFDLIRKEEYYALTDKNLQNILTIRSDISKTQLSKNIGVSYRTIQRVLNKQPNWIKISTLFKLCRELSIKERSITDHIRLIKTKNSFPIETKNFRLSPHLMRVTGHIIGDGGLHIETQEKKYRGFYVNNNNTLLDSFTADIRYLFGDTNIYFRKRKKQGNEIWLQTSIGHIFYELLDYKNNKNKKRIPKFIYNLNDRFVCPIVQALYDDEGYIYPQKYMIVISQSYKKLLNDLRMLIIKVGIKPNKILIHHPKNRTKMYYFSITGKENIKKFYDKINFKHPIKKEKLQKLIDNYREKKCVG